MVVVACRHEEGTCAQGVSHGAGEVPVSWRWAVVGGVCGVSVVEEGEGDGDEAGRSSL